MQKSLFLPNNNEAPVVQFSKLDENNKAEFLQFLIKNNITFDNGPGKQNVIAKVTLKSLNSNKNLVNKNSAKDVRTRETFKSKQPQISDKENNLKSHQNRKTKVVNKTPLKNKTHLHNPKTPTNQVSPFKKVKLIYQGEQKLTKSALKVNDSSISLKSHRNDEKEKEKGQTMTLKVREKTPDRKNQTQYSPVKSAIKIQQGQSSRSVSKKDLAVSAAKSARNVSYAKQSHQRLSNFKKQNNPSTMRESSILKEPKETKFVPKSKVDNKNLKVRNKTEVPQNKLTQSREGAYEGRGNQSFESLDRIHLVNKYKEYFNNFSSINTTNYSKGCIKQRPVCWTLNQVQKFLDEFYDDNFAKNTNQILNGSKRLNQSLKKGNSSRTSHLAESLQNFLKKKFNKVQKAIQYNLINLLYSVAFYINQYKESTSNQQHSSTLGLLLFEDFMSQKYELEEYLFFLFTRNILKYDFKKTFVSTNANSSSKASINKKQIDRFLKQIVGQNNTEILEEYHRMIFQKVPNYQIEINKFMKILIDDYKLKCQAAEQSHREKQKNQQHLMDNCSQSHYSENDQDSSLQNTFSKILNFGNNNDPKFNIFQNSPQVICEDSMEELTFGQDTKDMLKEVQLEAKANQKPQKEDIIFWESPYINEKNTKTEKQRLLKDEFNQMVAQKLCHKTNELVEILSNNGSNDLYRSKGNQLREQEDYDSENQMEDSEQSQWQQVEQLLFSKALCLFFTVIEMNKVKWLKELHITNPSQEDIEKVEEIQLFFRKIKDFPTAKDIAEFCKLILTVGQITEELSKFFV